jgi:TonB family protein
MAITQIPATSAASPPQLQPGKNGSGLASGSDSADIHIPVLLIQVQDDLARSRLREAFWISLIAHLLLIIALANAARLMPAKSFTVFTPADLLKNRELTYLEMSPDAQKNVKPPKDTNIISDKNRIATSRHPTIDRKTLQDILDSARAGAPGMSAPPAPKPQPASSAQQQAQNTGQNATAPAAGSNPIQPRENGTSDNAQMAKLEPPKVAKTSPGPFSGTVSPGAAIEEATRAAAANRLGGYGGASGDYGNSIGRATSHTASDIDIVSDTMGVDFSPYLSRVLHDVRENWYNLIPEVARAPLMKKGKVSIEFAILKDGHVAGMRLVGPSGDVSLDRAAIGGISGSNPFPPLPGEFRGQYLALRFHFFYNPDKNDLR